MSNIQSSKSKLFFTIMIFAFLWVIIGDLVAMHIHVIADIDIYNHSLFAKSNKTDKKCYKNKSNKSSDNSIFYFNLFTSVQNSSINCQRIFKEVAANEPINLQAQEFILFLSGRDPPLR